MMSVTPLDLSFGHPALKTPPHTCHIHTHTNTYYVWELFKYTVLSYHNCVFRVCHYGGEHSRRRRRRNYFPHVCVFLPATLAAHEIYKRVAGEKKKSAIKKKRAERKKK